MHLYTTYASILCLALASCSAGSITTSEDSPDGGASGGSGGSGDEDGSGTGDGDGEGSGGGGGGDGSGDGNGGGGGAPDAGFSGMIDGEPTELMGITNAHNNVRGAHGVGPMEWDNDLAAVAQAWADNCQWGHNSGRSDNYPGYVGENIYGASFVPTGESVTESWASEEASYDYDSNSCIGVCGHYTQIVWANSTKLGCAIANCPNISTSNFVVCDYAPGGNFNGERPY